MVESLLLKITYDGTDFFGWDCLQNRSIKKTLQKALAPFMSLKRLQVASRTDRGVHAQDQQVLVELFEPLHLNENYLKQFNENLPPDLRILEIKKPPVNFHPSLSTKLKEYRYYFHTSTQNPQKERFSYLLEKSFDLKKAQLALPFFLSIQNFRCFEDKGNQRRSDPICELTEIDIFENSKGNFYLKIVGNRFLYHMCRKIAGTLLYIGCGKLTLIQLEKGCTGPTLPPNGLILQKVIYDRNDPLPL